MKLLPLAIIGIVGLCQIGYSQELPRLEIDFEGKKTPLEINRLEISIVAGQYLTETKLDITFQNNLNRVLDGEFILPLSEGQTVSAFALEVNGILQSAVIVDRTLGQKAYESIIRQQVDPGLLQKQKGNQYKTRIYPIPAHGTKRVVITIQQQLKHTASGLVYAFPLKSSTPIKDFIGSVLILEDENEPSRIIWKDEENPYEVTSRGYSINFREKDFEGHESIAFTIPHSELSGPKVLVEQGVGEKNAWFYTSVVPSVGKSFKLVNPDEVVLVWDTSHSAESRKDELIFNLMDDYIRARKNLTIQLYAFSDTLEQGVSFEINGGRWDKLRKALENLPKDGGTNYNAIQLNSIACDEVWFVSDGLSTLSDNNLNLPDAPIVSINANLNSEHVFLRELSEGRYMNLINTEKKRALKLLLAPPLRLLEVNTKSGTISGRGILN